MNKDPLEEITESGFRAPTIQEDCRVPTQKKHTFLRFFIALYLQKNRMCGERQGGKITNFLDERGNPR